MFSEEQLSPAGQKKSTKYWYKSFLFKHIVRFGIIKKKKHQEIKKNQNSKGLRLPNASEF